MIALLVKADGISIVTESVSEGRFRYVDELKRMGANIKVDGRTAIIKGIEKLSATKVIATDLRAGAALVIAGLTTEGITEINDAYQIERGYENLVSKLISLGAKIKSVNK